MWSAQIGTAADVFALGLIYSEFLTGRMPSYDAAYGEPAVAVRSGVVLTIDCSGLDPVLADLVDRMLLAAPDSRPTIGQVHSGLMAVRGAGDPAAAAGAPGSVPAAPAAPPSSGLRGKLVGAAPAARPAPAPAPSGPPASGGLKGKLIGREPRGTGS